MLKTSRPDRTASTATAIIVVAVAVTIIHQSATRQNRPDRITEFVRTVVLAPAATAGRESVSWVRRQIVEPERGRQLALENERLRREVASLAIQNEQLKVEAEQMDVMRRMLKLPATTAWNLQAAQVIALKPSPIRDNALVKVGPGVHPQVQDVVLGPTGALVGQVVQVTRSVCDVLLITDPASSIGVKVEPEGRTSRGAPVFGICQGMRSPALALVDMPIDADIQPSDRVYTSGLGSVFPKGIPIGSVTAVHVDQIRSLKSAAVSTVDDLNLLSEVFVRL